MIMAFHRIDNALSVLFVFLSGLEDKEGEDRAAFLDANLPSVKSAVKAVAVEVDMLGKEGEKGAIYHGIDNALSALFAFVSGLEEVKGRDRAAFLDDNLSLAKATAEKVGREIDLLRRQSSF